MERKFQVIDLVDARSGRFVGQALYCGERKECPIYTIDDSRINAGEIAEAFITGAREVGGTINLTHINMPIEINTNTPYNEIRNTIIGEMETRITRKEQEKQGE